MIVTLKIDMARWGWLALSVLMLVPGLGLTFIGERQGQWWVGGLLCGFGLGAWGAFCAYVPAGNGTGNADVP